MMRIGRLVMVFALLGLVGYGAVSMARTGESALDRSSHVPLRLRHVRGARKPGQAGPEERARRSAEQVARFVDLGTFEEKLDAMLVRYASLPAGIEREALADGICFVYGMFTTLEKPGDVVFQSRLMRLFDETSNPSELQSFMIAFHGTSNAPLVDWYVRQMSHADPTIRFYAAEGLVWVVGPEGARAHAAAREALDHADPGVRELVAVTLATVLHDPADVDLLTRRLGVEEDPDVRSALEAGIAEIHAPESTKRRPR